MVQITIQDTSDSIEMTLLGHVSIPWVAELSRTWAEMAPGLGKKCYESQFTKMTNPLA